MSVRHRANCCLPSFSKGLGHVGSALQVFTCIALQRHLREFDNSGFVINDQYCRVIHLARSGSFFVLSALPSLWHRVRWPASIITKPSRCAVMRNAAAPRDQRLITQPLPDYFTEFTGDVQAQPVPRFRWCKGFKICPICSSVCRGPGLSLQHGQSDFGMKLQLQHTVRGSPADATVTQRVTAQLSPPD